MQDRAFLFQPRQSGFAGCTHQTCAAIGLTLLCLLLAGPLMRLLGNKVSARDLAVFKHEMELARSVQQALIPKQPPEIAGFDTRFWIWATAAWISAMARSIVSMCAIISL